MSDDELYQNLAKEALFTQASQLAKVKDNKAVCEICEDSYHITAEHNTIFPDSCQCRTCPLAKAGEHPIPHNRPNSTTKTGYFCWDCMAHMAIGREHGKYFVNRKIKEPGEVR